MQLFAPFMQRRLILCADLLYFVHDNALPRQKNPYSHAKRYNYSAPGRCPEILKV